MSSHFFRAAGHNRLLTSLSVTDLALIERGCDEVHLVSRQKLFSSNRPIDHVYFPLSGAVSLIAISMAGRRQVEVGMVGCEGVVGHPLALGIEFSNWDAFVQIEGVALRLTRDMLKQMIRQSPSLHQALMASAHLFSVQCSATALANAHGTIEARLARWLLMARDRHDRDRLPLTHDLLSLMIGVRRPGVTLALAQLETRGLVTTGRGHVTVVDQEGLREAARGLYGAPEAALERCFPRQ